MCACLCPEITIFHPHGITLESYNLVLFFGGEGGLSEISGANEPQSRLGPQGQSSKMGTWSLLLINNPGTAEYGIRSLKIKVQILALPLLDCVPWASPFILRMSSFLI